MRYKEENEQKNNQNIEAAEEKREAEEESLFKRWEQLAQAAGFSCV